MKETLSKHEIQKLLDCIDRLEDKTLIVLGLTTGIRRGDITILEIANIDWDNETLRFFEQKKRRYLTIPLEKSVVNLLRMYVNTMPATERYLFNFGDKTANRRLQKYVTKAGIKKHISFHSLRATFVKRSKEEGRDVKMVCQITGDSERTILQHYSQWTESELKDRVDSMPLYRES
ncbi:MAG: site-specific integrase [Candidatus Thermoplasmatota archaeon]|nr:site-specific integrase [Candidatus Thermoplasmatota archaeon]MDD5778050.1 site-specific integrase [Candidatus Thermoplasmatota archaeon]